MGVWFRPAATWYPPTFHCESVRGRPLWRCPLCGNRFMCGTFIQSGRRYQRTHWDHLDSPECMDRSTYRIMTARNWETLGVAHHVIGQSGVPIEEVFGRRWAPSWAVMVGSCTDVPPDVRKVWLWRLSRGQPCSPEELFAEMDGLMRMAGPDPKQARAALTEYLRERLRP